MNMTSTFELLVPVFIDREKVVVGYIFWQ